MPQAEAEDESSISQDIQGGKLLGNIDRVLEGQQEDAGSDVHVACFGGESGDEGYGLQFRTFRQVMVSDPDGVQTYVPSLSDILQERLHPLSNMLRWSRFRGQRDPKLQIGSAAPAGRFNRFAEDTASGCFDPNTRVGIRFRAELLRVF